MAKGPTYTKRCHVAALLVLAGACRGATVQPRSLSASLGGMAEDRSVARGPMRYLWSKSLAAAGLGRYLPVERARPLLHPERDRVYVGSTAGFLHVLSSRGRSLLRYRADAALEGQPSLHAADGELYFGDEHGTLHALKAADATLRWKKKTRGPLRGRPLVVADAVYVITHNDSLVAMARSNGEELWTYQRDLPEGFSVTSHADLLLAEDKLIAAFTDGTVVALRPSDGTVLWERDTGTELPETIGEEQQHFWDVDTTPVLDGDLLYVAAFSAGVFALKVSNGSIEWRLPEYVGVTSLAVTPERRLLLLSADLGVVCLSLDGRRERWRRPMPRGAPSLPEIRQGVAWFGESQGGFVALELERGKEVGRIEAGYGFSASPAIADRLGFVLSNGATLFAFAVMPPAPVPPRR